MARSGVFPIAVLVLANLVSAYCPRLAGRGSNFAASECIFLERRCSPASAQRAGLSCVSGTPAAWQRWVCRAQACAFCKCQPYVAYCSHPYFARVCDFATGLPRPLGAWNAARPWNAPRPRAPKPAPVRTPRRFSPPAPKPPVSQYRPRGSNTGSCVRRGIDGHVSIPVSWTTGAGKGWGRARNGQCLVWKKNKWAHTIDPPGSGKVCYEFTVDRKSHYYFTMISRAPHVTEFNDAWVSFPTGGLRLYRAELDVYRGGYRTGWFKAYQNKGKNEEENQIRSIDFNGHQFETPMLYPGKTYKVCLSGRSSRFVICKLHFVACSRKTCANWNKEIQYKIRRQNPSPCV